MDNLKKVNRMIKFNQKYWHDKSWQTYVITVMCTYLLKEL